MGPLVIHIRDARGNEKCKGSTLGCAPKVDHYGKNIFEKEWRVIHHLSHPRNDDSVNSLIDDEFKEVNYVTFKEVVSMMLRLGVAAFDLDRRCKRCIFKSSNQ